jgi:hypothetical protein
MASSNVSKQTCSIFRPARRDYASSYYCRPPELSAHWNVRFGSLADICAAISDVRYAPDSDRKSEHPSVRRRRVGSAWVAQEAEASRLISYFSTLCTEQCQLKISCGRWSWQARGLEITDRAVVTLGKQKRVNILNRTSKEFKNRPLQ